MKKGARIAGMRLRCGTANDSSGYDDDDEFVDSDRLRKCHSQSQSQKREIIGKANGGAKKPRLATNVLRAGNRLPAHPQKLHDTPERLRIRDKKLGEHKVTQVQSAKRNNQSKCIRRKPANSRNIARVQSLDSVAMREDDDAFSKGMYSGGENENSGNELEEREDVGVEERRIVCDGEVGNGSDGEYSVPHGNGDDDELEVEENNGMVEDVRAEKRIRM